MGGGRLPSARKRLQPGRGGLNRHGENPSQAYWLQNMIQSEEGYFRPRFGLKHTKTMGTGEITHLSRPGGYNHLLMLVCESGALYKLDVETGTATSVAASGWPTGPMTSIIGLVPGGATRWIACRAQIGNTAGPVFHYDLTTLTEITTTAPADGNWIGTHLQSAMRVVSGDGTESAIQWSKNQDVLTWDTLYQSPPAGGIGTVDAVVPFGTRESILFGPNGIARVLGIPPRNLAFENVLEMPIATPMNHVCKCKDRIFFCAGGPRVYQFVQPGIAQPIEPPIWRDLFLAAGTSKLRAWYDAVMNEFILWDRTQYLGYRYSLDKNRWEGIITYTGNATNMLGQAVIDQGASQVDEATQPWAKGFVGVDKYVLQWDSSTYTDATSSSTTAAFTCKVETMPDRSPDPGVRRQLLSVKIFGVGSWTPYYKYRTSPDSSWTTVTAGAAITAPDGRWDVPPSAVEYCELVVGASADSSSTLRFHSFEIVEQTSGTP